MILVVFGHALACIGCGGYNSVLGSTILTFRMPIFFFVSGFFAYRLCERWSRALVCDVMKRKIQAQIFCTIIFFALFQICRGGDVIEWVYKGFGGYWFTIVLFQIFVVFLALSLVSKLFKCERILEVLMIVISLAGIVALAKFRGSGALWTVLCGENFCKYFQFFTLGIFCRKYQTLFIDLIAKNWFKVAITICYVACLVLYFNDTFRNGNTLLYGVVHDLVIRYAGLFIVVSFFFTKREFFGGNGNGGQLLQYIGRRTLDIYVLHYFFLPDTSFLAKWLAPDGILAAGRDAVSGIPIHGNILVLQLVVALAISAVVVAICCLLSEILRSSPTLATWLFGVKHKAPPPIVFPRLVACA